MKNVYANLTYDSGSLIFDFSYDAGLVGALKGQIPYTDRQWDRDLKHWRVMPKHAQKLAELTFEYLGILLDLPIMPNADTLEVKQIKLMYLGKCKDKGQAERVAAGHDGQGWNLSFPESVLRAYFKMPLSPLAATTHYSVLGVKQDASQDEIKSAYRRLSRQWHPDVCKQPDATAQFQKIGQAYEALKDERKRAMYDAGLSLQASMPRDNDLPQDDWMPPLRCGWLLVEGESGLGKFRVSNILAWEDVIENGRVMVTSWGYDRVADKADDSYTVNWI